MEDSNTQYLFVYGTLMEKLNQQAHELMDRAQLLASEAFVVGRLFDVDNYPGIILANKEKQAGGYKIFGELYKVDNAVLQRLDLYEECDEQYPHPHEYTRHRVNVHMADKLYSSWIYEYNFEVSKLKEITSGDYYSFFKKASNQL